MRKTLQWLMWIWRSWPIIFSMFLIVLHFFLIKYTCFEINTINKNISLFSQITGGLLILYSIDSNIGVIKEKNLLAVFYSYINAYPRTPKTYVHRGEIGIKITNNTKARVSESFEAKTIENKINHLHDQVNSLSSDIRNLSADTSKKITTIANAVTVQNSKTAASLKNVESKLEGVSVGGIKIQLLGVFLMIYGSVSGYAI